MLILALMVLVTAWLSANLKGKGYAVYSIISTAIVFCAGSVSGVAIPMRLPLWGIYETIVMSAFLLWTALSSFRLKGAMVDIDLPGAKS